MHCHLVEIERRGGPLAKSDQLHRSQMVIVADLMLLLNCTTSDVWLHLAQNQPKPTVQAITTFARSNTGNFFGNIKVSKRQV